MIGRKLAQYEILEKVGEGGMGEVYKARDTSLNREVAIKILPDAFARDPDRLSRFQREAQMLAALDHPGLATVHGLHEEDGVRFLAMELVPGQDLSHLFARGPLALPDAIDLATQVTEALAAAHSQGIIHRDLKPSNIMVTPAGRVKILDFGLAKSLDPTSDSGAQILSHSPTRIGGATASNVILGTAAYMSPEQARGAQVDARTDVWAFGCVLYESLTGTRAFDGDSVSDLLAAVLRDPVDWSKLPETTPPALHRLLRRSLERDPARRLHSLADARIELADARTELEAGVLGTGEGASQSAPPAPRSKAATLLPWALAALLAIAATAAWTLRGGEEAPRRTSRFILETDSLETVFEAAPAISPAGDRIVYTAAGQLWIRDLDDLDPRALSATEGASHPFFSPDGASVGFHVSGRLWKMSVSGGGRIPICDIPEPMSSAGRAEWGEDGNILFGSGDGPLYSVSADGGTPRVVVPLVEGEDDDFHGAGLLPGGRGALFVVHLQGGDIDRMDVWDGRERRILWEHPEGENITGPVFDGSGHVLFHLSNPSSSIWALPVTSDLTAAGDPFLVRSDASMHSVSRDGTLVYIRGFESAHRLVRVSGAGAELEELIVGAHLDDGAYSPSGNRLLYLLDESVSARVIAWDLTRNTRTEVAQGKNVVNPFWISETTVGVVRTDSSWVEIHDLNRPGVSEILFRAPAGTFMSRNSSSPSMTPDGSHIFMTLDVGGGKTDIWIAPLDGTGTARPVLTGPTLESLPRVSPDGRLLAFESDATGRREIYVSTLSEEGEVSPRRWQVSSEGGRVPQWSSDGSRIYYGSSRRSLMEVEVGTGDGVSLGAPRQLFDLEALGVQLQHGYSVTPDGEGFVFTRARSEQGSGPQIVVVQNWAEEFRGR